MMIAVIGVTPPTRLLNSVMAMATTRDGNIKGTVIKDLRRLTPGKLLRYNTYAPGIPKTKQITVDRTACQIVNQSTGQTLISLGFEALKWLPKPKPKTERTG